MPPAEGVKVHRPCRDWAPSYWICHLWLPSNGRHSDNFVTRASLDTESGETSHKPILQDIREIQGEYPTHKMRPGGAFSIESAQGHMQGSLANPSITCMKAATQLGPNS